MTYKFGTNYGRIGTARSANLQAYYQFDGDLTDSSGNGFDLSLSTGTTAYTSIPYGGLKRYAPDLAIQGCKFDGATRFEKSAETEFVITGAFTMHMLLVLDYVQSGYEWVMAYGRNISDGGNSPTSNYLYSQTIGSSKYQSFIEYTSGGGNSQWDVENCPPIVNQPVFVTQTRDASGNYEFYVDGVSMGVSSVANYPNSPTGGDSAGCALMVGGQDANDGGGGTPTYFQGAVAELQILNIELTPAQVLEDARKVMPWL